MLGDAQRTMRQNYINGGPGVIVSGLAWGVSAVVVARMGVVEGMIALFVGGMLIYPLGLLISEPLKGQVPAPDKGLMRFALLTLPLLFGGLFLAYIMSAYDPILFFVIMAVTIGLRYLLFFFIYGRRAFIGLGLSLILIGTLGYLMPLEVVMIPMAVGLVEIAFGLLLTLQPRS